MRRKGYKKDKRLQRLSRFFYEDRIEPVTPAELAAAHSHGEHDALEHQPRADRGRHRPVGGGRDLVEPEKGADER